MNEMQVRQLLDNAADAISTEPPRELLQKQVVRSSPDHRTAWKCAAAAVLLAAVVLALTGWPSLQRGEQSVAVTDASDDDRTLTDQQIALATSLARGAADANTDATVSMATATLTRGQVLQSNTGHQCTSGALLTVDIYGTFPRANVIGRLGASEADLRVVGQRLIADPATGVICLLSSLTGRAARDAAATVLFENDGSP